MKLLFQTTLTLKARNLRCVLGLIMMFTLGSLTLQANADSLSVPLRNIITGVNAKNCTCLVEVTAVNIEPLGEKYVAPVADLIVKEVLIGQTNLKSLRFCDPGHRSTTDPEMLKRVGSMVPPVSPMPHVGDKWILLFTPNPEVTIYMASYERMCAITSSSVELKFLRTMNSRIRDLPTKESMTIYLKDYINKDNSDGDRLCFMAAAACMARLVSVFSARNPEYFQIRSAVMKVLNARGLSSLMAWESSRYLVVESDVDKLNAEECKCIRFMGKYLANCTDIQTASILRDNLVYNAATNRAGGQLWIYPEIMDMLELRAQKEEANNTEKSNAHTRSYLNLMQEKFRKYADHPDDRKRLHTVQLPY